MTIPVLPKRTPLENTDCPDKAPKEGKFFSWKDLLTTYIFERLPNAKIPLGGALVQALRNAWDRTLIKCLE